MELNNQRCFLQYLILNKLFSVFKSLDLDQKLLRLFSYALAKFTELLTEIHVNKIYKDK